MNKSREKTVPGARMFGSALASLKQPSHRHKPKSVGLNEIKNPESTSLDPSLDCSLKISEDSIPILPKISPVTLEGPYDLPITFETCSSISPPPAMLEEDEYALPITILKPPPGFESSSTPHLESQVQSPTSAGYSTFDAYSPNYHQFSYELPQNILLNSFNLHSYPANSSAFTLHFNNPEDSINVPMFLPSPVTHQNCYTQSFDSAYSSNLYSDRLGQSLDPANSPAFSLHFRSPADCALLSMSLPSPVAHQESSSPSFDSDYSSTLSSDRLGQSLDPVTVTPLSLTDERPDMSVDYSLPVTSGDSGCPLFDDSGSSASSLVEDSSLAFTGMSYYHMANSESPSPAEPEKNDVALAEETSTSQTLAVTAISGRVNRRNISRLQGSNTSLSSFAKNKPSILIDRTNLPPSLVPYASSEDSGAELSMDDDPSRCRGCEEMSDRVARSEERGTFTLPDYGRLNFLSFKCEPGFIDSHCHLDYLFERQNYTGTYTEYMRKHKGTYPASYEGCVAVFCHPYTFHKGGRYLEEDRVWGAFGCHPHHSKLFNATYEAELEKAIQQRNVRALGEIGLDYSNRNDCSVITQQRVFRMQLKIARREFLPLVIHCRDANEDVMRIMKEMLPRNYIIHLHCFTDGWDWAEKWLDAFPNLCIGITNLVTYSSATPTHDVAKKIPLDRLLLETDAPYFLPRKVSKSVTKYSHPGMAIHVAAQIATLRGIPLKEVIHHTRHNTMKVYGIK